MMSPRPGQLWGYTRSSRGSPCGEIAVYYLTIRRATALDSIKRPWVKKHDDWWLVCGWYPPVYQWEPMYMRANELGAMISDAA